MLRKYQNKKRRHCSQSNGKHGRGVCVWRHGAITRNVSVFSTKVHLEGQENQASKRRQHTCFQCKKAGHIKVIYPLLNNDKFKKKKKARCATWDDIDNETKNEVINKKKNFLIMMVLVILTMMTCPLLKNYRMLSRITWRYGLTLYKKHWA